MDTKLDQAQMNTEDADDSTPLLLTKNASTSLNTHLIIFNTIQAMSFNHHLLVGTNDRGNILRYIYKIHHFKL